MSNVASSLLDTLLSLVNATTDTPENLELLAPASAWRALKRPPEFSKVWEPDFAAVIFDLPAMPKDFNVEEAYQEQLAKLRGSMAIDSHNKRVDHFPYELRLSTFVSLAIMLQALNKKPEDAYGSLAPCESFPDLVDNLNAAFAKEAEYGKGLFPIAELRHAKNSGEVDKSLLSFICTHLYFNLSRPASRRAQTINFCPSGGDAAKSVFSFGLDWVNASNMEARLSGIRLAHSPLPNGFKWLEPCLQSQRPEDEITTFVSSGRNTFSDVNGMAFNKFALRMTPESLTMLITMSDDTSKTLYPTQATAVFNMFLFKRTENLHERLISTLQGCLGTSFAIQVAVLDTIRKECRERFGALPVDNTQLLSTVDNLVSFMENDYGFHGATLLHVRSIRVVCIPDWCRHYLSGTDDNNPFARLPDLAHLCAYAGMPMMFGGCGSSSGCLEGRMDVTMPDIGMLGITNPQLNREISLLRS